MVVKPDVQSALEMIGRPADAQGLRLLEHLVVPGRFVVGMQQDVRVGIDQARQQRQPRQLDRAGILRSLDPVGRADAFNFAAADQNHPSRMRLDIGTIEDTGRPEQKRLVFLANVRLGVLGMTAHTDHE